MMTQTKSEQKHHNRQQAGGTSGRKHTAGKSSTAGGALKTHGYSINGVVFRCVFGIEGSCGRGCGRGKFVCSRVK